MIIQIFKPLNFEYSNFLNRYILKYLKICSIFENYTSTTLLWDLYFNCSIWPTNLKFFSSIVVGGYSAAALHATGATYSGFGTAPPTTTRRYHAHQASFSRRTTIGQIEEFLCQKFSTKLEDLRLWHFKDDNHMRLLIGNVKQSNSELIR